MLFDFPKELKALKRSQLLKLEKRANLIVERFLLRSREDQTSLIRLNQIENELRLLRF